MTIDGRVEMFYDDAWNDITEDVHDGIVTVNYGRPDEHGEAVPTDVSLALDNSDARYSPLDPRSELFGKIGRGTKLRVRIGDPQTGLELPGVDDSYASTPDHASLDITGDLDVRIEITPETWRPETEEVLLAKWSGGTQRSYMLLRRTDGALRLFRSTDGALDGHAQSNAVVPADAGRIAVRATLDVDDGAGNRVTTFYTAPDISGPWTQLGTPISAAGTISIFASTSSLAVGADSDGRGAFFGVKTFAGRIHAAEVRDGIDGTVVASPDFSAREPGDDSAFNDFAPANLLQNTAEGGTADTDVTTVNSGGGSGDAFDVVTTDLTSTIKYNVDAGQGSLAYRINGVDGGITVLGWTNALATQTVLRFWIKFDSLPSAGQNFLRWMNTSGTGQRAALVGAPGSGELGVIVHDAAVSTVHDTGADRLQTGVWYRFEASLDTPSTTTGAMVLQVFEGDSLTPVPGFDLNLTGNNFGDAGVAQIWVGKATSAGTWPTIKVDNLQHATGTLSLGRTWTLHGRATIADPSLRASVAAVSWQPAWDETATDALQAIEAAGILRRLGQGQEPLRSSLFRDLTTKDNVVAYWPLEDGETSTRFASGLQGHAPLSIKSLEGVKLADFDGFTASAPIPTFTTMASGNITGDIPMYAAAQDQRVFMLVHVPEDGINTPTQRHLFSVFAQSEQFHRWQVWVNADGALRLNVLSSEGNETLPLTNAINFQLNGKNAIVSLWLHYPTGAGQIDWQLSTFEEGSDTGGVSSGQTIARIETRPRGFTRVAPGSPTGLDGTALGHIGILDDDVHGAFWDTIKNSLRAWSGERAGARLLRLASEEAVSLRLIGAEADTEQLGPQAVTELLGLLEDAPAVDLGPFGERRDAASLLYRTRADLYNQEPAITLDMSGGVISNPFDPPLDDQRVRNDVTVSRVNGSSVRAVQETGPLSILDPPDGIGGRYTSADTLNVASDGQLRDQASWRLHLGTVDEHRIASLEIAMEHHPELQQAVLELQAGDLIRITNPVAGLPPGPLDLIALGTSERITPHTWRLTINCAPGSPWTIGEVSDGADEQQADTDGSETAAQFVAGTDTSMTVAVADGSLWTTDAVEFPFEIRVAGVVLNVTAIAGTASPQTFTVDATPVNGVAKTISVGADVRLANPMIVGL